MDGELDKLLLNFQQELSAWLKRGGDERLREFDPLEAWGKVVDYCTKRYTGAIQ